MLDQRKRVADLILCKAQFSFGLVDQACCEAVKLGSLGRLAQGRKLGQVIVLVEVNHRAKHFYERVISRMPQLCPSHDHDSLFALVCQKLVEINPEQHLHTFLNDRLCDNLLFHF